MPKKSVMAMNWNDALKKARKKYPNAHIVSVNPATPAPRKYWIVTKGRRKK